MRGIYRLNPFLELPNCNELYNDSQHGFIPCYEYRRKIIALRVYFALIIINFLFITLTTGYFIYRHILAYWDNTTFDKTFTAQDISRQWQSYSLRKKGLFGTVLGAIGHLIFSTAVLLYQVIVTNFTCDIYLWGPMVGLYIWTYAIIWRTYRLHLAIRLNELRQKFSRETPISQSERKSSKSNLRSKRITVGKEDKDYKWFMNHKDDLNMGLSHQLFYVCGSLTVIFLIITLAETLGIWVDNDSLCEFYMGNYMILAMTIFFFIIIVPFIFWYLRGDSDAHGIRREIWVSMTVAVPCFILCIVWLALFEYPSDAKPAGLRGIFGPCNWLVIVTTTYHIMSVVLPVFQTLSIHTKKTKKDSMGSRERPCCCRRSSALSDNTISRVMHSKHKNISSMSLQNLNLNGNNQWELTVESLNAALRDPAILNELKNWAVKDFSVENILFYDRYLQLVDQVKKSSHYNSNMKNNEEQLTFPQEKLESNYETSCNRFDIDSPALSTTSEVVLDIPLGIDQIPNLIDFYNTFITEQSPLQVNISHKARSEIDDALAPLAKQTGKQRLISQSGIPYFLQSQAAIEEDFMSKPFNLENTSDPYIYRSYSSNPEFKSEEESELCSFRISRVPISNVSLQVLEVARTEVFWNIFTGLFPKFVEAYNADCNH